MPSDHDYVNFSEDHELNYILRKVGKAQSESNREKLRKMGDRLKAQTGKQRLTHEEFFAYVNKHLNELE